MIGCHTGKQWKDLYLFIYFCVICVMFFRATGDDTRSMCTTVCKWTYLGHAHMQHVNDEGRSMEMEACGWDDDFWEEIGLRDLVDNHHSKIGTFIIHIYMIYLIHI